MDILGSNIDMQGIEPDRLGEWHLTSPVWGEGHCLVTEEGLEQSYKDALAGAREVIAMYKKKTPFFSRPFHGWKLECLKPHLCECCGDPAPPGLAFCRGLHCANGGE
mgnify:CR=1 FL=1|tara:strand:- start:891 stop:1211 length:321 start_codon:yes stop_codon:yes gene_type:complete